MDGIHAFLEPTQERYKWDFDQRLCKGRERIESGDYEFIDVLDGVTKTLKPGHAVKAPYRVLGQEKTLYFYNKMSCLIELKPTEFHSPLN